MSVRKKKGRIKMDADDIKKDWNNDILNNIMNIYNEIDKMRNNKLKRKKSLRKAQAHEYTKGYCAILYDEVPIKRHIKRRENEMEKLEDIVLKKGDIAVWADGDIVVICEEQSRKITQLQNTGIKEIKRPVKYETIYKRPQEILNKKEKEYLSAVIRPFKDKAIYLVKRQQLSNRCGWINIVIDNTVLGFPDFDLCTMYEGMEADKKYTPEELGL